MPGAPASGTEHHRILVIRRDNIGDLVCTTPLFSALRAKYPHAWIGALVNSYNADVLRGNSDLSEVLAYRKSKHYPGESALAIGVDKLRLFWRIRAARLDYVILASPEFRPREFRIARFFRPAHIVGYAPRERSSRGPDIAVSADAADGRHEVERVFALARALGIEIAPPPLSIAVEPRERQRVSDALAAAGIGAGRLLIGIHISARKPSQRWPAERFAALIRALHERDGAAFVLLWAPGAEDDPRHPGDDEKARSIADAAAGIPLLAWPTAELASLIAALDVCDRVICSDGGAMHLAAALGKSILCFFGNSDATRWRPWDAPYHLLQPASKSVMDIGVEEVLQAYELLPARGARGG